MSQPFIISSMVGYFKGDIDLITAIEYGLLLVLGVFINTIVHHPMFLCNNIIGLKLRLSCSGLIYKKVILFILIFIHSCILIK